MMPGSSAGLGLKKGAWTAHEDMLLKNCVEKYGEGKWHLIPVRTGLNRCRKSCRLRWLNYPRPNIKRGDLAEDEVDLMLRLHKLLGNRWSLIAGRIPGRTANDVKNYWNIHIQPRSTQLKKQLNADESLQDTILTTIKPQPVAISKTLNLNMGENPQIISHGGGNLIRSSNDVTNRNLNVSSRLSLSPNELDDKISQYVDELFDDRQMEIEGNVGWSFGDSSAKGEASNVFEPEDINYNSLFDYPIDDVLWNFMDSDKL